jgi:signal transduction histidine kinase
MDDIQQLNNSPGLEIAKTSLHTALDLENLNSVAIRQVHCLTLALAATVICWTLIVYLAAPIPSWWHFGLGLVATITLFGLLYTMHARTVQCLEGLRCQLERNMTDLLETEMARLKQAEQRANAELVRVARIKSEFLSNISHELRTPLSAILGLSQALQEQTYGDLNQKQLETLHSIEKSGQRLLTLINDILDLSKLEADELQLHFASISASSLCQSALQLVQQSAQDKKLKLSVSLDDEAALLRADERRLRQILVNLLSNAIKFTPKDGEIGLEVAGDEEHNMIHFSVWDTGIGIPRQNLGSLFRPFEQLNGSLSRPYAGTGLGLCLVSRLTRMHGGRVLVESEQGQGSRFTVSLPWRATDRHITLYQADTQPLGSSCIPRTD